MKAVGVLGVCVVALAAGAAAQGGGAQAPALPASPASIGAEVNGFYTRIAGFINEHYGNLVTYLRLNGMVPPSTAGRGRG